jgi:hypothetical protein
MRLLLSLAGLALLLATAGCSTEAYGGNTETVKDRAYFALSLEDARVHVEGALRDRSTFLAVDQAGETTRYRIVPDDFAASALFTKAQKVATDCELTLIAARDLRVTPEGLAVGGVLVRFSELTAPVVTAEPELYRQSHVLGSKIGGDDRGVLFTQSVHVGGGTRTLRLAGFAFTEARQLARALLRLIEGARA